MSEDTLARRQAGLDEWRSESVVAVVDWAPIIGIDSRTLLENPLLGIEGVDAVLGPEDLSTLPDADRNFVAAKLIAHVGAIFTQTHGGGWVVDDDPDSPTYTRYVIRDQHGKRFDPGRAVLGYFEAPPGRRLADHLRQAEAAAT